MSYKQLLFKSDPYQHESFIGYLIRVAELNSYPRASWIGEHAGLKLSESSMTQISKHLRALAEVLGVPIDRMQRLGCFSSTGGNNSHVRLSSGEIISKKYLHWPSYRVCFACLREKGYVSGLWELKPVTHCPWHGTVLRDVCPICEAPVKLNRGYVLPCRSGCVGSKIEQECSNAQLGLMRLLSNKFLEDEFDVSAHRFPSQLTNGCLPQLLDVISFLGMHFQPRKEGAFQNWEECDNEAFGQVLKTVSEALYNWPDGFFTFLDRLLVTSDQPNSQLILHRKFGPFYKSLMAEGRRFPLLFEALQDYMNVRLRGHLLTGRGSPAILKYVDRRLYLPGFIARKRLEVGREEFKRLVDAGYLETRRFITNYGEMVCVHRESLEAYMQTRKRLVGRRKAADILGVSLNSLTSLTIANVIRVYHSPEKDGWPKWYYDQHGINHLLADLQKRAKQMPPSKGALSLRDAITKYNKQGLSYAKLLSAIRQGAISVYCTKAGHSGLAMFEVRSNELEDWYGV
jgi:hypothetical protein